MRSREPTAFQSRVYDAVCRIPPGKVASYAAVASAIGCRSALAVGQAMRCCPYDDVPCHRVIASGNRLGGYAGKSAGPGVRKKKSRLLAEGVQFDDRGRIVAACVLPDSPGLQRLLGGRRMDSENLRFPLRTTSP